jgi:hypothetical protein
MHLGFSGPINDRQCFGSGSAWICIGFSRLDPDLNPEGQKLSTKTEKRKETLSFEVLDVLS